VLLEYARNLTAYRANLVHFLDLLIGRHRDITVPVGDRFDSVNVHSAFKIDTYSYDMAGSGFVWFQSLKRSVRLW
jgi:hypothetical protein